MNYIIPPGETIKEVMRDHNITSETIEEQLEISHIDFCKLLVGEMPINNMIAEKLENITEISSSFWLNLEQNYRRDVNTALMSSEY